MTTPARTYRRVLYIQYTNPGHYPPLEHSAHLLADAGADVLFVEAPQTEAEVEAVAEAFPDTPLVFNWVEGGKTPQLPVDRIRELGFALVIFPVTTLFAAADAVAGVLARIGEHDVPPFDAFTDMIGLPEVRELEARFATE